MEKPANDLQSIPCWKHTYEFRNVDGWSQNKPFLVSLQAYGFISNKPQNLPLPSEEVPFPQILSFWNSYREKLIKGLESKRNISWTGDGRFDSMGHSANNTEDCAF